jgi:hypothetical protein
LTLVTNVSAWSPAVAVTRQQPAVGNVTLVAWNPDR